jgi:hypothetical protein
MDIAPDIPREKFTELNLNSPDSPDWQEAIKIFRSRIKNRFIDPIEIIINNDNPEKPKYGFAVLAIDCLLIETLQAFRDGLIDTDKKSKIAIRLFLTKSPSFKQHFDKITSKKFYYHFRCGILHQGETQYNSLVTTSSKKPMVTWNKKNNEMIINRRIFHEALMKDFDSYINDLEDKKNTELRNHFLRKMYFICRDDRYKLFVEKDYNKIKIT